MIKKIEEKLLKLRSIIRDKKALAVAFSGGIDSSLITKVAFLELKDRAIAVTIDSDIFSERELEFSKKIAAEIGIKHIIVKHSKLDNPIFANNSPHRCYHCRREEMETVEKIAHENGIKTVAFGVNYSDHNEHRPGIMALKEKNFFIPLEETKIGKPIIPQMAKELGLSNYNMPSTTCLASRIPYGIQITAQKLTQVEKAENYLHKFNISQSRVRHHEDIARIEVPEDELTKIMKHREEIITEFKKLGFSYISLDLQGYRSGSMDEVL